MKKLTLISALLFPALTHAASVDVGSITEIYSDNEGHIGIKLDTGFINADQNGECPTSNGWIGLYAPHENLLKTIYHARETGATVTVVTNGCEGPTWVKLQSIYLKNPIN